MTQEQLDGLKRGDKVWIPGTLSHRPGEHWFVDIPGASALFDEDELLHSVEIELPRPSTPEGYEEFWPESIFELDLGDYVGGARVVAKKPGAGEFRFSLGGRWLHFETTKALGVPFYRPIKKEPEDKPGEKFEAVVQAVKLTVDGYETGVVTLPTRFVGKEVVITRKPQGGAL